jgi:PAP2 superfamily C-terminal
MIDATSGLWVVRLGLVIAGLAGWFWTQRLIGQRAWLLILYALRQICQGLCALPPPDGMIWRRPGIPSLLVTYGTATDLFFSGHTAIAVFGCIELARIGGPILPVLGVVIAIVEASAVLVLRAHYTMDVFAAIVTALWAVSAADALAPGVDRALAALVGAAR